jgi:hypothetical protein
MSTSNSNRETNIDQYKGFRGLPPLVGLMTVKRAAIEGITVAESVERLKRLHWALKRLHFIFVARIAATPVYELKMAFSLHGHYCAEHVGHIARRVREMRQPPYGLETSPSPFLDLFFDEILCAPTTAGLVLGVYEYAIPAINAALEALMRDTSRLFDHPTYRVCRFAQIEFAEVREYADAAVTAIVTERDRADLASWSASLQSILARAGGLDGRAELGTLEPSPTFSLKPFKYDPVPQRDERFVDPYNMGVNAEAMLFNPEIPAQPKTIMLFFKRMREIDVPEMMSSILTETTDKPWEYYRDMTRQLWDEARHAMMGEVGFVSLDIDWRSIPFNFTWSLGLNTILTPLERHAVLYTIEQGLMPKKTGKEYEWEIAVASASRLSELIQDYDWADEIVHAKIGREWLVPQIGSQSETLAFGDKSWSRTLVDWAKWREDGLTDHRNWWPEVYTKACEVWRIEPDTGILNYNTTYESIRADMKTVGA